MRIFGVLILLYLTSYAFAQNSVHGKVFDSTGTAVSNAVVYFPELNARTLSDSDGNFQLTDLPAGIYTLQVTHIGFQPYIANLRVQDEFTEIEVHLRTDQHRYGEVVVFGFQNSAPEKTANEIVPLSAEDMRLQGAMSISDGMSRLPGVSQITTGSGISKPVIRGLFGNRIQTVLLGLRFDNQQWQDEHGLGLSDVGIDRIEIIKGPASLLYGSEAMGGVLNLLEEKPALLGTRQFDFSTRFFSNTLGYATDLGWKGTNHHFSWRLRAGTESHADYLDGNAYRVLNSRFGGYYAKAGIQFKKGNWTSANNYFFSLSNFGFLMDSINLFDPPDNRNSRSFDRPHHTVLLNIFSSQNTRYFENSKLKINLGFQSNNRMEQEGGNKISLNMLLNTYLINALWIKNLSEKAEISLGTQDFFQTNKNLGSRTIVPDAMQLETSVFSYYKYAGKWTALEGGIRLDLRNIRTFQTGTINTADPLSPGNAILPFNRLYHALNGAAGITLYGSRFWNVKANVSSGYRPGNLAELSSNGLHEGTLRYEIGDIHLKMEQNLCADASLTFSGKPITLSASAYYNQFFNYIYLQPTSLQFIGFQIFQYVQKNAALKGAELTANLHPEKWKWMTWTTSYSCIRGTTADKENLPFVPAPKINSDLSINWNAPKKSIRFFVKPGFVYVFSQHYPNQFETNTASYYLVNAAAGLSATLGGKTLLLSISGNNLLDNAYFDHLSRFKYFGVYNIGRNISLNFKMTFTK